MSIFLVIVIVLLAVAIFGAPGVVVPTDKHAYGWTPSGIAVAIAIVLLILILLGKL